MEYSTVSSSIAKACCLEIDHHDSIKGLAFDVGRFRFRPRRGRSSRDGTGTGRGALNLDLSKREAACRESNQRAVDLHLRRSREDYQSFRQ